MPKNPPRTGYTKQAAVVDAPTLRSDTTDLPSVEKILNTIISALFVCSEEQTLEFGSVDSDTAKSVLSRLLETSALRISYNSLLQELRVVVRPTSVHDAHQPWINNSLNQLIAQGLLTFADVENLEQYVGTTFSQFGDGYSTSRKEPDMCIRPVGMILPTIVLESGWSESRPQLYRDRDLWLHGGAGSVQLVMVIKWTKNASKTVKGDIEVFNFAAGNINLIETQVIFPAPTPPAAAREQVITIYRGHLWGPQTPSATVAAQPLTIMVESLRTIAMRNMQAEGYTPA